MSSSHISSAGRMRVLAKIKAGLADGTPAGVRQATVAARLAIPPKHLLPERVNKSAEALKAQLRTYLEGQSATVIEVAFKDDIPGAIAGYLRQSNLPQRVRAGADAFLAGLPWNREPALERMPGAAAPTDEVGLSHAMAGISETGTLVLASGTDNPVTVNFMPEAHIVVLEAKDIVGPYEAAWARVRAIFGTSSLPRTINFISGPSRTGDIGGKLVMGAHGPRRMCVIIVRG